MNCVLYPSLEHIALVKVAATLWNQDDVKKLLAEFRIHYIYYTEFKSEWVKIEAIAMKKVEKLPLPKEVKKNVRCLIRPTGFQIAKWMQFHDSGCKLKVDLPNEFCWTAPGIIDKKKTAEVMIKDESIDITTRYKLACVYCLEDEIPKLWDKISIGCQKSFCRQEDSMQLVKFWTYYTTGKVDKMNSMIEEEMDHRCSPYQYAFEIAANGGNRVATEYFFQRLTIEEREESLVNTAAAVVFGHDLFNEHTGFLKETYSDILRFLLSQLNEEQRLEVFVKAIRG